LFTPTLNQQIKEQILAVNYIEITVTDQGSGIPDDEINYIFDRYKHSKENPEKHLVDHSSIGIGLNFTRKLVELHKGFIRVENNPNDGASFSFVIPADNAPYEPEIISSLHTDDPEQISDVQFTVASISNIQPNFNNTILVIEDDPQLNSFLRDSIKRYYKVITAFNGEDGLQIIKKKQPDLVVSDVVMPKMDGLELLKLVKESDDYCHILFVLLSSRNEISAQIEGLKTGADVYVGKPFDMDFLIHTIDSQLKNRDRIHKIFLRGKMPEFKESEGNQVAMQFLARLNEILENDIANTNLDMTFLADKLKMSKSSLYRKFCLPNIIDSNCLR
jgi:DNA-binding response OmpR family regulator